ncbi:hypothetical protein ACQR1I_21845 [Bradyrhizobium sp. HKCCYLS2038]|uniref:hypothetical protein n=1 Tax=unclassified Bradyrhizobium TaxID=2631580 RepID=UPI003EBC041E
MKNSRKLSDKLVDRVRRRIDFQVDVEGQRHFQEFLNEGEPPATRVVTDVVDWLMVSAPHTRFELFCIRAAVLEALESGRGHYGEYVVYSGGGFIVMCGRRSAVLLLGQMSIEELLAYLEHERDGCSQNKLDSDVMEWMNPQGAQAPKRTNTSSKRTAAPPASPSD